MTPADADAVAAIYNEGIEDRIATFETAARTADDVRGWRAVVVEDEAGAVIAFAALGSYNPRPCYAGIAEVSVYVARAARRRGAGRAALEALIDQARAAGVHKLVSRVFVENRASRALIASLGFREVGVHLRHGQLDGVWRDVVVVEKLL
jgi:phosphinothricin acetyltransferase